MRNWTRLVLLCAIMLTACSPANQTGQIVADPRFGKTVDGDAGLETLEPVVDILFVVDNSASMSNHQSNLAANIGRFVSNFFTNVTADFHVGVLTTDTESGNDCCGKLVGTPTYVDRNTPNFQGELAHRMLVGTSGSSTEMVFDPLYLALTDPNLNGLNAGFLRKDAFLAIVFITDAEDQSVTMDPDTLQSFLVQLKGRSDRILSYAAIVPSGVTDCPRDEGVEPHRIERFLSFSASAGKNEFSLCAPDFGDQLAGMGKDLADRIGNLFVLQRIPVVSTIELKFGSQLIPRDAVTGWSFDPAQNAILLGPKLTWTKQPAGTKLRVKYDFTEFDNKSPGKKP